MTSLRRATPSAVHLHYRATDEPEEAHLVIYSYHNMYSLFLHQQVRGCIPFLGNASSHHQTSPAPRIRLYTATNSSYSNIVDGQPTPQQPPFYCRQSWHQILVPKTLGPYYYRPLHGTYITIRSLITRPWMTFLYYLVSPLQHNCIG